jgi:hypothetical protein
LDALESLPVCVIDVFERFHWSKGCGDEAPRQSGFPRVAA